MTFAILYWILMLFWLVFGLWSNWPAPGAPNTAFRPLGGTVLLFVLLLILGWRVFGTPVHS
jgi:hypothetical protein